jgi:hypothetical protein
MLNINRKKTNIFEAKASLTTRILTIHLRNLVPIISTPIAILAAFVAKRCFGCEG